jgi:MFS family permease
MTNKQKASTAAWVVVIIAFFGGFALANIQNKVPPVIDVIMLEFNIGETDAGWLTSVFTIMGMVTAIPASFLMRKFGAKKIGVTALIFAAVGSAIGVFTEGNLTFILVTRVIEGTGVGMIAVVGPSVISEWFPPEKRGLPMGLWGSWMMCSQTLLFLLGVPLVELGGWQAVWWFTCIFAVVVLSCNFHIGDKSLPFFTPIVKMHFRILGVTKLKAIIRTVETSLFHSYSPINKTEISLTLVPVGPVNNRLPEPINA